MLAVLNLRILAADGNVDGLQLCNGVGEHGKPQRGRRINGVRAGNAIVAKQRRFKVGNGNFGGQMRPCVNLVKRHLLTKGDFALRAEPVFKRLVRDLVELAALCGAALEAVVFEPCEMATALRGMRREDRADDFAVVVLCRNAEVARQDKVPCLAVPLEHDAAQPLSFRHTVGQALEQVVGQSLQIVGTG